MHEQGEWRKRKAAKLLLYYCFMNLAKAFILTCRQQVDVNNAQHGVSEKLNAVPNPAELTDAYSNAFPSPNAQGQLQNFSELLQALTGTGVNANLHRYDLPHLIPQVVPGHRLWVQGATGGMKERFVAIERIEFRHDAPAKALWLRLYIFAGDLRRIDMTHAEALATTRIGTAFQDVACADVVNDRPLVCFEQTVPTSYTGRPSDEIPQAVASVRHML